MKTVLQWAVDCSPMEPRETATVGEAIVVARNSENPATGKKAALAAMSLRNRVIAFGGVLTIGPRPKGRRDLVRKTARAPLWKRLPPELEAELRAAGWQIEQVPSRLRGVPP